MMGVGAIKRDVKTMILTGFIGLVSGACSKAIGEFVVDYSELHTEIAQNAQMKWDKLLHPLKASISSALGACYGWA